MAHPGWPDLMGSAELNEAVEGARAAVTALRRHPANRTGWPRTAAAASIRAARASAALDGAPLVLDLAAGLGSLSAVWPRAPLQALARLHTLAAADLVAADELGRPRARSGIGDAMARLADLVTSAPFPAPVQVALVHGELLTLAPFGRGDGVVARAAARLTMISTGLDPAGLGVPEVAHLRSESRYHELAAGYSDGGEAAILDWVAEICRCLAVGAREGVSIADSAG
jgi:hypothetical protein